MPQCENAKVLMARIERQTEESAALKALWTTLFPEFPAPDTRQFQIWLKLYDFGTVVQGLEAANIKFAKRVGSTAGQMGSDDVVRYASGTMKGLKLKGGAQ